MQKINSIFINLLNCRKNSAVQFNDSGENEAYSAKIYWKLLQDLDEAIHNQIKAWNFGNRTVIKDNIVQLEIYLPDCEAPASTPFAVFQVGHWNDMPKSAADAYTRVGEFCYNKTFQKTKVVDAEQIHYVFDNLEKQIKICNNPFCLMEAVESWKQNVVNR